MDRVFLFIEGLEMLALKALWGITSLRILRRCYLRPEFMGQLNSGSGPATFNGIYKTLGFVIAKVIFHWAFALIVYKSFSE